MHPQRFSSAVVVIWGGLLSWAGYFLFVYVFAAIACARQFHHLTVAGIDIVTFATFAGLPIALATMLWTMRRARHRMREAFPPLVRFLAIALGALALLGMVWTALPVVLLSENC